MERAITHPAGARHALQRDIFPAVCGWGHRQRALMLLAGAPGFPLLARTIERCEALTQRLQPGYCFTQRKGSLLLKTSRSSHCACFNIVQRSNRAANAVAANHAISFHPAQHVDGLLHGHMSASRSSSFQPLLTITKSRPKGRLLR